MTDSMERDSGEWVGRWNQWHVVVWLGEVKTGVRDHQFRPKLIDVSVEC